MMPARPTDSSSTHDRRQRRRQRYRWSVELRWDGDFSEGLKGMEPELETTFVDTGLGRDTDAGIGIESGSGGDGRKDGEASAAPAMIPSIDNGDGSVVGRALVLMRGTTYTF